MPQLVPDYLNVDYTTIINRLKTQLKLSDTFVDYNFEGSNIAILTELLAYIGELNVFYLNKVAQNLFIETADVYETVNKLARAQGYEPQGPISARGTVTVSASGIEPNHEYRLFEFTQMTSTEEVNDESIQYANVIQYTVQPSGGFVELSLV